jgi:putative FmdB family regulatory protein
MRMYSDYKCESCANLFEKFVERDEDVPCPQCGSSTRRLISPVRCKLDGTSGDFPGAAMKFAKQHEREAQKRSS